MTKQQRKQKMAEQRLANQVQKEEIELFESFSDVNCNSFGNFEYEVERKGLIFRLNDYERDEE